MTEAVQALPPKFWVEKTIIKDRPDRNEGPHALGKALWSPQRADANRDIYRLMREVKEGDLVFHFVDNAEVRGVSVAAGRADDAFEGLAGTEWAKRPAYRIPLRDYRVLNPPINRSEFLDNAEYRDRISKLLEGPGHGLFFNREFKLNQGSYITAAPIGLIRMWDEIYRKKAGSALLPGVDLGNADEVAAPGVTRELSTGRVVAILADAFQHAGLKVTHDKILQLVSSLASKRFLVLTGLSGSGKSRLAQAIGRRSTTPP
jgi:hypothetical protein